MGDDTWESRDTWTRGGGGGGGGEGDDAHLLSTSWTSLGVSGHECSMLLQPVALLQLRTMEFAHSGAGNNNIGGVVNDTTAHDQKRDVHVTTNITYVHTLMQKC